MEILIGFASADGFAAGVSGDWVSAPRERLRVAAAIRQAMVQCFIRFRAMVVLVIMDILVCPVLGEVSFKNKTGWGKCRQRKLKRSLFNGN